jgi:hypothetical protein
LFFASEEDFAVATKVGGEVWFAATLAGFGSGAASKAGLFCASSEEEDFRRAMKLEG